MRESTRRQNTASGGSWSGLWRVILVFIIVITLVFLGQMMLFQFRSGFGSLLGKDVDGSSFSFVQNSSRNRSYNTRPPGAKTTVALLITARAGSEKSVSEVPFLQECLPSLLTSVEPNSSFAYKVYFGFDLDDPIYDNTSNLRFIRDRFDEQTTGYSLTLNFFRYRGTRGKPVWVWNRLAREAYQQDVDYFYQVNDDLLFVTKDWTARFVKALLGNKIYPGLGAAGPSDVGNSQKVLLTQSFVSRIHLDIFNHFYPPLFQNWYSDDWMAQIYNPDHLFKFSDIFVNNTLVQNTRYEVDSGAKDILGTLVKHGRASIEEFLERSPILMDEELIVGKKLQLPQNETQRRWR